MTGFAKTVLNGTLIKLQYKPFKKQVKLYYLTLVFIALYLSQIISYWKKVGYHLVCHHARSSNMFTDSLYISVFCSNECLFTPVKNAYFLLLDKIKWPLYWFFLWIWGKSYTWMDLLIHEEDNGANPISVNYCIRELPPYNYMCVILSPYKCVQIYRLAPPTFSLIFSKLLLIRG